ncbi:MFS transporter [Rathayibacter tanaceti]|uniref:MFS transporter n=1 Tax=Rathayibacter tanaceti TaxID=1671680 RepID=UPI0018EE89EE|nr:MFS transporter [Rathayibacter tanaceti]
MNYLTVLRLPHVVRVLAPTIVGKLSFAMVSLGLLLLLQAGSNGFAISGAVAGVFGVGNVVVAPLRARLVDRFGARRVLPLLALGYAAGLVSIVCVAQSPVPVWVLVLLGALSGVCTPPLGAVVRGIWALLSPTDEHRRRAYSLDAVIEELVFIIGPLLVGVFMLLPNGPVIAVLTAAATGLLGTLWVALGPTPTPVERLGRGLDWRSWIGPLRHLRFWPVLLVLAAVGLVLGAAELLATAYGQAIGDAGSGILLACFAIGSAIGGLVYGARNWRWPAVPRMVALGLAGLATLLAMAWITHVGAQLAVFVVMGLFVAPSLIAGYVASDDLAPAEERTEASALINTAVNAGAALALALGGALLDGITFGAAAAYLSAVGAVLIAAAIVVHVWRPGAAAAAVKG